jgi:uncharacterized protein involved in type VI secretion and phage assembly
MKDLFDTDRDDESSTMTGVVTGKVTDNEDPKGLGRVKVTYPHRDSDDESRWARVATEMASSGYGTFFLPEVGDEVLVAFEDGDIHYPYVVGSLYNGQRPPNESNGDGDNDIRQIKSRGEHVLEFDDDDSEPLVKLETSAGHVIKLEDKSGSEKVTIEDKSGSNSVTMDTANNEVSIEAAQTLSLSAPTIELSADSEVNISSNAKVNMEGNAEVNVSSKGNLNVESNGMMGVKSTAILTLEGSLIQIN